MSIPTSEINPTVLNLLNATSKNLNIQKPNYDVTYTAKKGDGYMSIIYNGKINNEKGEEIVNAIVKISPENKIFREQSYIRELFSNEIMFYVEICPSFTEFQKQKGIDIFEFAPKCYASSFEDLQEGLVLENLRGKGFQLWNRKEPMDDSHIELTLKGYAKFHALSIAFKDQCRTKFNEYKSRMNDIFELYDKNSMNKDSFGKLCKGVISYFDPITDKGYLEKFNKYLDSMNDRQGMFYSKNMDDYGVICHGDGWCNNMMYQYKDPNSSKPTNICLLDFQIIHYSSPVLDFTHFFYTSTTKKQQDNLEYYLDLYYKTLAEFVKLLGSDPEKTYSRSMFDDHWRKYCTNGINVALFMIKIMTSDSDEVPDFTKAADNDGSILEALAYEPKNDSYKARIRDVIVHFCEKGFL